MVELVGCHHVGCVLNASGSVPAGVVRMRVAEIGRLVLGRLHVMVLVVQSARMRRVPRQHRMPAARPASSHSRMVRMVRMVRPAGEHGETVVQRNHSDSRFGFSLISFSSLSIGSLQSLQSSSIASIEFRHRQTPKSINTQL